MIPAFLSNGCEIISRGITVLCFGSVEDFHLTGNLFWYLWIFLTRIETGQSWHNIKEWSVILNTTILSQKLTLCTFFSTPLKISKKQKTTSLTVNYKCAQTFSIWIYFLVSHENIIFHQIECGFFSIQALLPNGLHH